MATTILEYISRYLEENGDNNSTYLEDVMGTDEVINGGGGNLTTNYTDDDLFVGNFTNTTSNDDIVVGGGQSVMFNGTHSNTIIVNDDDEDVLFVNNTNATTMMDANATHAEDMIWNNYTNSTPVVPTDITYHEEEELVVSAEESVILRETLRVYGSFYLFSLVSYCILRKCFPKLFNIRSWVPEHECELAKKDGNGIISWLWSSFFIDDEEFLEQCGMDSLCFMRALRFGRQLSLMGCLNAAYLIPLYATANDHATIDYIEDGLSLITTSNLSTSSPRFIATVIAAYVIFIYSMYKIYKEYQWYTTYRHKFLTKLMPRNYAVYVSGIPSFYQSSYELAEYFNQCNTDKNSVYEAHVALDIPNLEAKATKRDAVLKRLEHIMAVERKTGHKEVQFQVNGFRGLERIETRTMLERELSQLNHSIQKTVHRLTASHDKFRSQLSRSAEARKLNVTTAVDDDRTVGTLEKLDSKDLALQRIRQNQIELEERTRAEAEAEEAASNAAGVEDHNKKRLRNLGGLSDPHLGGAGAAAAAEADPLVGELTDDDEELEHRRQRLNSGGDLLVEEGIVISVEESDTDVDDIWKRAAGILAHERSNHTDSTSGGNPTIDGDADAGAGRGESMMLSKKDSLSDSVGKKLRTTTRVMADGIQSGTRAVTATGQTIAKGSRDAAQTIALGSRAAGNAVYRGFMDVNHEGFKIVREVGSNVVSGAGVVAPLVLRGREGTPRNAGFVVFKTLHAQQTALQMIHHPKPNVMVVREAPDPHDIFWRNVGLDHRALRSGRFMALMASSMLCLFWSFPTALIASFTELQSLKETMPKLGRWIDDHPSTEPFFAQIAPLLLLFITEVILPVILKHFAKWEGHVSSGMLEASLFVKLGTFMIIQTFFISMFSTSITSQLANYMAEPQLVFDLLAFSLAESSSYSIQFLLVTTFFLQSIELLRMYPLATAFLRKFFGPKLTSKERSQKWGWLHSLEDPPDFWHAETFAQLILFYMAFFVFAVIAPIISPFCTFCFLILESGYKHQFIHNYPRRFETGGRLWKYFIQFTLVSIIIAEITLIALLALNQSIYAGPALGPLLALTIVFAIFVQLKYSRVSSHLPTRDCVLTDYKRAESETNTMEFAKKAYLQPALDLRGMQPDIDP